jgi:hypothetical protein
MYLVLAIVDGRFREYFALVTGVGCSETWLNDYQQALHHNLRYILLINQLNAQILVL